VSKDAAKPNLEELTRWALEHASDDLDAVLGLLAEDAVYDAVPLGASYRGVEEIGQFLADWYEPYESYETEAREVRHLGNGVVLGVSHQAGRLVDDPHAEIREVWAFVTVWTSGTVTRILAYADIDEARAVAERLAEERA
jgi:ketosteroid isomerase-like protein